MSYYHEEGTFIMYIRLVLGDDEWARNERTLGRARVEEGGRSFVWVLGDVELHFSIIYIFFIETTKPRNYETTKQWNYETTKRKIAATANIFDGKICSDFPVDFAGNSL